MDPGSVSAPLRAAQHPGHATLSLAVKAKISEMIVLWDLGGGSARRRWRRGTGNEGVGEHVRSRFHWAKIAGENCGSQDPHRIEENLFLLPDRSFRGANSFRKSTSL